MLYAIDLLGTFVFALSGAFRATRHELDLLGVTVLAVATGIGGGLIRDMLLGATPAASLQDEAYLIVCVAGGVVVMIAASHVRRTLPIVMWLDSIGLGVFAAMGAAKAAAFGLGPIGIMMMGALTATGGGVVRDVLVREVPAIVRHDFYATAALLGSGALVVCAAMGAPQSVQLWAAALVTTGLRVWAIVTRLSLPRVRRLD